MRGRVWLICAAMFAAAALGGVTGPAALAAEQVKGTVFKPDGKPAAGAKVYLYYLHDITGYGSRKLSEAMADADGRFAIEMPEVELPPTALLVPVMRCMIVARLEGYALGLMPITPSMLEGYEVFLDRGRDITCIVRDMAGGGNPVEGALVAPMIQHVQIPRLLLRSDQTSVMGALFREVYGARTDKDGTVTLSGVPTGSITIAASHEKLGGSFSAPTKQEDTVQIALGGMPIVAVQGKVTREDTGAPVEGALVWMPYFTTSFLPCTALTAKDGSYRLAVTMGGPMYSMYVVDPSAAPAYAAMVIGQNQDPMEFYRNAKMERIGPAGAQVVRELNCQVKAGKVLRGKVVNTGTGQPMPGAVVQISPQLRYLAENRAFMPILPQCRMADAKGEYQFRFAEEQVSVVVAAGPPGYVILGRQTQQTVKPEGDETTCDLEAEFMAEAPLQIDVKTADGQAARDARMDARFEGWTQWSGRTGRDGRLMGIGMPRGGEASYYVLSAKRESAASGTFTVPDAPGVQKVELALRPARTAVVTFQDMDGKPVQGRVTVGATLNERQTFWLETPGGGEMLEEWRVGGLLPGVTYVMTGNARGFMPAQDGGTVRLRVEENVEEPKVVLKFTRLPERPDVRVMRPDRPAIRPAPVKPGTQPAPRQNFEEALASLKDALWKKQDPVQEHLTWYGLEGGIALADAENKEVRYFPNLFGFDTIRVNAIAFGKEQVWLGTDKGLMAWDRAFGAWTRLPGDGVDLDVPVTAVVVEGDEVVTITVQRAGQAARQFAYNPRTMKWTAVKE